jgi:hypothetical protein
MEKPEIIKAFKKGVYYAPATKHYACVGKPFNISRVYCDRCTPRPTDGCQVDEPLSYPLAVCIGYKGVDLCMKCVDELSVSVDLPSGDGDDYDPVVLGNENLTLPEDMQTAK